MGLAQLLTLLISLPTLVRVWVPILILEPMNKTAGVAINRINKLFP
jgi:hypothetical protein